MSYCYQEVHATTSTTWKEGTPFSKKPLISTTIIHTSEAWWKLTSFSSANYFWYSLNHSISHRARNIKGNTKRKGIQNLNKSHVKKIFMVHNLSVLKQQRFLQLQFLLWGMPLPSFPNWSENNHAVRFITLVGWPQAAAKHPHSQIEGKKLRKASKVSLCICINYTFLCKRAEGNFSHQIITSSCIAQIQVLRQSLAMPCIAMTLLTSSRVGVSQEYMTEQLPPPP